MNNRSRGVRRYTMPMAVRIVIIPPMTTLTTVPIPHEF